jgi:hypothetical protein
MKSMKKYLLIFSFTFDHPNVKANCLSIVQTKNWVKQTFVRKATIFWCVKPLLKPDHVVRNAKKGCSLNVYLK